MIERLEAEESLLEMTRVAMGTGSLKKEASNRIMGKWQRSAEAKRKKEPVSKEAFAARLAFTGIRFEE